MTTHAIADVAARAKLSQGRSAPAIYAMAARVVAARHAGGGTLLDVGCGTGALWPHVRAHVARYTGVDAVRYDGFPADGQFVSAALDAPLPVPDRSADVVAALEVIEHLENPRAFMRELARVARPGALILVSTPNQLSALSLLTLALKQRFSAFHDAHYPAHLSALLEVDLRRMAVECGLSEIAIEYSGEGRIVLTARTYPPVLSTLWPRLCSDNVMLVARRPA